MAMDICILKQSYLLYQWIFFVKEEFYLRAVYRSEMVRIELTEIELESKLNKRNCNELEQELTGPDLDFWACLP